MAEIFAVRLKPAHLLSKTDFGKKLISFNKKITSIEEKHLEVKKTTKKTN